MWKRVVLFVATIPALWMPAIAEAKPVPNLQFKSLTGDKETLADLRGGIVVVNFWATWCGPCREELPLLTRLNTEYSTKKVRFVEISEDENGDSKAGRAKIDAFMKANGPGPALPQFEVWTGADTDTLSRLRLGIELPATIVMDENGEVICRLLGEVRETELRSVLDWLVNGRTGEAPPPIFKHL